MGGGPNFCTNCGAQINKGAVFCGSCGQPAAQDETPLSPASGSGPAGPSSAPVRGEGGNVFEIWRRVLLAVFLCGSVLLACYAPVSPLLSVSPVDFALEQKKAARGYMGISTEEKKRLASLPQDRYIEEVTRGRVVPAEGQQWESFYHSLAGALTGSPPGKDLSGRVGRYRDRVYFRSAEAPFAGMGLPLKDGDEIYLKLSSPAQERYIRVRQESLDDGDFGPGSTITGPPGQVVYPYRLFSPVPALIGLALYMLLPWPPKRQDIISYSRWRVIMGDFASMLLLVMFFGLPILIVGGSVQALTGYLPFTLIFWGLAAFGVWMLKMSSWTAGLQIEILPDRLRRITSRGRDEYAFASIEYIQPIIQAPPRWLIRLLWLAAFAGRSVSSAGSALILSGSECGGIRVVCRDGSAVNIWFTDQTGNIALPGYERILDALKNAGVPVRKDVMRVEAITAR